MVEPTVSVGVMLSVENRHGTDYIVVRVMRREDEARHPLNISFGMFQEYGDYADLILDGFVTDRDHKFIANKPCFYDVTSVEIDRAKKMAAVLTKIQKQMIKDSAGEPGDVFASFCKAIGAKWAVVQRDERRGGSLADHQWSWMSVTEGRNYLRRMIATAEEQSAA